MSQELKPDLCVIGAGSGGLSVAAAAAAMGVSVVLVEKGQMGGDCLNYGCVPSKALIAAARVAHTMRHAGRFGIDSVEPRVDGAKVHAHIHDVIKSIAPNDSQARFEAMNVKVIRAPGKFVSARVLEAGDFSIRARRFVVATGSAPSAPPIPGIELVRYLTNESIFDLTRLPARLVIIGAGPIGIELAQAFRRLGSEVVVIEAGRALGREDPELAAVALNALAGEGVELREGVAIERIEPLPAGVRVLLAGGGSVEGTDLLVAAGRTPNVGGLGLEAAGVNFDRKGVHVDRGLRTSNRRIYAVGDVAGMAQFTHAANYHAGLVLRSALFRLSAKVDETLIPRVTYCDPEIAVAGLSEADARAKHGSVNVLRWPFSENDRAHASQETAGHIKLVTAPDGTILGVGIVGPHAGELIGLWQLALSKRMKFGDIARIVLPYPTLSEVSKRAAILGYADKLRSPWLGRILRFMRRFG